MNDFLIIVSAGFITGITTVLFGFGGGFVVVPFVYQITLAKADLSPNAMHIAIATSTAVMVFNAGWASYKNWRSGLLSTDILFPLIGFIAIGAFLGSWFAGWLSDAIIRVLFILYMLVTIADCLLRKGFLHQSTPRRLSSAVSIFGGCGIGIIAALLGVGGSVMAVPLLRRHGYAMKQCVSAANPLSLPVALCGTIMYACSGWKTIQHKHYLGFIDLKTLILLVVAGMLGMLFTRKCIPPVPDALHARIYILLLFFVLIAIAF